jgi:hypothetical protein
VVAAVDGFHCVVNRQVHDSKVKSSNWRRMPSGFHGGLGELVPSRDWIFRISLGRNNGGEDCESEPTLNDRLHGSFLSQGDSRPTYHPELASSELRMPQDSTVRACKSLFSGYAFVRFF